MTWVATAAVAGAFGCHALAAEEIWTIDNLSRAGTHALTVEGEPKAGVTAGKRSVSFDGAHDGLFADAIPVKGAEAFTIELLLYPANGGTEAQRFFHVQDSAGKRALLELRTDGHGKWWLDAFLRTELNPQQTGMTLIDPRKVHPTNRWHWVALRTDGRRFASFVDGVKELEADYASTALGEGRISIGVRQNHVYWFKGAIAEIRFHREALPEEKLQRVGR